MSYKIRIMRLAQNDMREIFRYIADDLQNRSAAIERISLIDERILSLKENPHSVALVRYRFLASKGFRLVVVKSHLVFFVIREESKTVSVMRVLYGRRDWMRALEIEMKNTPEENS